MTKASWKNHNTLETKLYLWTDRSVTFSLDPTKEEDVFLVHIVDVEWDIPEHMLEYLKDTKEG
jgi:hypothetical protein